MAAVLYVIVFTLALGILASAFQKPIRRGNQTPTVTVIVAVAQRRELDRS